MSKEGDLKKGPNGEVAINRGGQWHVIASGPGEFAQVRMMARGDAPVSSFSLAKPQMQALVQAASLYDPSFSPMDYDTRRMARMDLTSGKTSENLKSLNTVIGHLGTLKREADAMHSGPLPLVNHVTNALANATGSPRTKGFEAAKLLVMQELAKASKGGVANEGEVRDFEKEITPDASPAQISKTIKTFMKLLDSRIEAVRSQYSQGMKRAADGVKFYTPEAERLRNELLGSPQTAASAAGKRPALADIFK